MFSDYPPLRSVSDASLGLVLADIESHLKPGHIYKDSDKITWAHEGTHGINSDLRQKFGGAGLYCLANKFVKLESKVPTSVSEIAKNIPSELRGGVYDLYLVKQAKSWGDFPLYILDEAMGYGNGTACLLDLCSKGLYKSSRSDTVMFMLEFVSYSATLAQTLFQKDYKDEKFYKFVGWFISRSLVFWKESKRYSQSMDEKHDGYLNKLKNHDLWKFIESQLLTKEVERLGDFGTKEYL